MVVVKPNQPEGKQGSFIGVSTAPSFTIGYTQWRIQDFTLSGGEHQPMGGGTGLQCGRFSVEMCENERIESRWGGAPVVPPGSTNDEYTRGTRFSYEGRAFLTIIGPTIKTLRTTRKFGSLCGAYHLCLKEKNGGKNIWYFFPCFPGYS